MPAFGAVRLHGLRMRTQQVVRRDRRLEGVAVAGREQAMQIAAVGDDPRLVERDPQLDAVVERLVDDARVVGEPVGHVGIEPAAAIVERGRQVPVVQRRHRLDAGIEQLVDQPLVEPEPALR